MSSSSSTFFFRDLRLRSLHEKDTGLSRPEEREGYFLFYTFDLRRFSRQVHAPPDDDNRHNKPQCNCVDGIPECFLGCCDTSGAENDQGTGGAYMHELCQQHALRVYIEPNDQNPHSGHGRSKRGKVWEPKSTVWSRPHDACRFLGSRSGHCEIGGGQAFSHQASNATQRRPAFSPAPLKQHPQNLAIGTCRRHRATSLVGRRLEAEVAFGIGAGSLRLAMKVRRSSIVNTAASSASHLSEMSTRCASRGQGHPSK